MTQENLTVLQDMIDYLGSQADRHEAMGDEAVRARYIAEIDGMRTVLRFMGYTIEHRQIVKKG